MKVCKKPRGGWIVLLVVGSIGLDRIVTPKAERQDCLGGSAIHFAHAARFFGPVGVVGIVGDDFPAEYLAALRERGIQTEGIEIVPGGRTFRWHGRYFADMDERETVNVELNVFADWKPRIPEAWRKSEVVFLANGSPQTQLSVLEELSGPELTVCDTMDLWIKTEREELEQVLRGVDGAIINESEALMYTAERTIFAAAEDLLALGLKILVVKKGTHGSLLFLDDQVVALPAWPVRRVCDPTGAGDSFAGGFLGFLAARKERDLTTFKKALADATCIASFNVEDFGAERLAGLRPEELEERLNAFREMLSWD